MTTCENRREGAPQHPRRPQAAVQASPHGRGGPVRTLGRRGDSSAVPRFPQKDRRKKGQVLPKAPLCKGGCRLRLGDCNRHYLHR